MDENAISLTEWFLQGLPAVVVAEQVVIMGIVHGRGGRKK